MPGKRSSLRLVVALSAVASIALPLVATPGSPAAAAENPDGAPAAAPTGADDLAGTGAHLALPARTVFSRPPLGRSVAPPAAVTPPPGTGDAARPLTLAFGGDVHFEAHVAALLQRPATSLSALRPYLAPADLAVVNLETSLTTRGTPAPKEYRFRAPTAALTALAGSGVDVVSMANNHAVDYGATGLRDTLTAKRTSPVRIVGIGSNSAEAYAPAIVTVRGRRVAVLAASQLRDWTLQNWEASSTRPGIAGARPIAPLISAVRRARRAADVVVVYVHWGIERMPCPESGQREAARALAAAGADVIIGSHPHVTQGAGRLGSAYVAYSLGNFVWYSRNSTASTSTGVLTLTLDGRRVTASRWTPLRIGATGVPAPPSRSTAAVMLRGWQASRGCTGLRALPS
jgi:poly-gamma-glutamate capsule biosynthesis protein CapA/YwtB (metallophosphatase superfamily)